MEREAGFLLSAKTIGAMVGAVALFSSAFYGISWMTKLEYKIERGDTTALQITETIKEVRSEVKDIKDDFKIVKEEITSIKISLASINALTKQDKGSK